ncbi:MAG TPA: prolyl oligopeptidase family serine peptidase [Planctomycetota bacterium]|jgi:dipeptidyl aminopeptidase/acylaminoacyl peptidase|nr:prolyl oligopeptidase family serine peptidase [Planctomycetota bacterium]
MGPHLALPLLLFQATAPAARPLRVEDLFGIRDVADPRVSPEGKWVAFTVTTHDLKKDESDTDIFMVPLEGGEAVRLTTSPKPESHARWSPDGRSLAFLSGREGKKAQVWLLDRRGGEAAKLTDFPGGVSDFSWSPDSKRLALVVSDPDPDEPEEEGGEAAAGKEKKTPKPIVIRRLQFKRDGEGYLREVRKHVHLIEIATKKAVQVTEGPYDDDEPVWSPDGRLLAFSSNRTPEPDSNDNSDIFVIEARPGPSPRTVTTSPGPDRSPIFSPDGLRIAYLAGPPPEDLWYGITSLASVAVDGSASLVLTAGMDRNVSSPRWAPDGKSVLFLLEDGGNVHLASAPPGGNTHDLTFAGDREVSAFDVGPRGELVALASEPNLPAEVFAAGEKGWNRLTKTNDAYLAGIRLGPVRRFAAKSRDGTAIDAFLTLPPDAPEGARLPAILRIHGGPAAQYSTEFNFEWQLLAAHGYAVVAANPRGSSGYGRDFSRAIWADWGNRDFEDVTAAVDAAVERGVADPDRLGVGGWSYGGILTNYVLTKTDRFKAAVSGASEVNYLADYGTDHYQREWEVELGLPWRNAALWMRLSPFFQVERIVTPTLVMGGADDLNVPLLNSEQLYQALRRLGRETELVVYPGQGHAIGKPSYWKDRLERYLAWYDRHLKAGPSSAPAPVPEALSLLGVPLFPPPIDEATRKRYEENLAKATADFVKAPDDADAIVWLGRRTAYLGRFRDAIDVYSRGIANHPADFRLLRHRGHRYLTVRELDRAIADLERATRLIEGVPDQVEPDGEPSSRGAPPSTSHFNIWYHLGLAHYLKGDFESAARAYRACMKFSRESDDRLVATSDWLYRTLRRLGREAEAASVLEPIRKDLRVLENDSYFKLLLLYKGERAPEALLDPTETSGVNRATLGYGVGNWHLFSGRPEKARAFFEEVVRGPQWPAFGFLASEAELARMRR